MDKLVQRALLYDHYGELLNEKQQRIVEYTVSEDMSLSEIGEMEGISRQAASDLLKRADERLEEFENKLKMIGRRQKIEDCIIRIRKHPLSSEIKAELDLIEKELKD